MSKLNIRLALIPLFIGFLHAFLMIYIRFDPSLILYYGKAVAVHSYSLLVCWPFLLIFENSLQNRMQRLLELIFLIFYGVSVFYIWTSTELVYFKYLISPDSFQFLSVQLMLAIILILSSSLQAVSSFMGKSERSAEVVPGLFLATQCSVFLAGIISLLAFAGSIWKVLRGMSLEAEGKTLWLGMGHLPIQLMSLVLLEKWLIWTDFSGTGHQAIKKYFQLSLWSVPAFIFLVLLNQLNLLPWDNKVALIPNLFIIPVVFLVGYRVITHINRAWLAVPGNLILLVIYCLFTFWGGLTGLQLAFDPLVRAMTMNTLLMPSHFHPLVAVGFTGTVFGFYLFRQGIKYRRGDFWVLLSFLLGVAFLSYGLRLGGFDRWIRRMPVAITDNPAATILILIGGLGAAVAGLVLVYKILRANTGSVHSSDN